MILKTSFVTRSVHRTIFCTMAEIWDRWLFSNVLIPVKGSRGFPSKNKGRVWSWPWMRKQLGEAVSSCKTVTWGKQKIACQGKRGAPLVSALTRPLTLTFPRQPVWLPFPCPQQQGNVCAWKSPCSFRDEWKHECLNHRVDSYFTITTLE